MPRQYRSASSTGFDPSTSTGEPLADHINETLVIDGAELFDSDEFGGGFRLKAIRYDPVTQEPIGDALTLYGFSKNVLGWVEAAIDREPDGAGKTSVMFTPPYLVRVKRDGRVLSLGDA